MRGGLISMLYNKANDVALTDVDTASSLTLMSADIERIVTGMETSHEVSRRKMQLKNCLASDQKCSSTIGDFTNQESIRSGLIQLRLR